MLKVLRAFVDNEYFSTIPQARKNYQLDIGFKNVAYYTLNVKTFSEANQLKLKIEGYTYQDLFKLINEILEIKHIKDNTYLINDKEVTFSDNMLKDLLKVYMKEIVEKIGDKHGI